MAKEKHRETSPKASTPTAPSVVLSLPSSISLVIPCYNEAQRVGRLVGALREFDKQWDAPYEVIVVDDGSTDGTVAALENEWLPLASKATRREIVRLPKNSGKGTALQAGVAVAQGVYTLTLDADMATHPLELKKWLAELPNRHFEEDTIYIGSREHGASKVAVSAVRKWVGLVYNGLVQLLTPIDYTDTQCGFKLYPTTVAKELFGGLRTKGWAHDVELLTKAGMNEYKVQPMPIAWTSVEGTKVSLVRDSFGMFGQLVRIATTARWDYFVKQPLASLRSGGSGRLAEQQGGESALYRLLFAGLAAFLLIAMPLLSFDFGMTGDEYVQHIYGGLVNDYIFQGKKDALTYKDLYNYGGGFDFVAEWFNRNIGWWDDYQMRHVLNSLTGWFAMVMAGLIARRLSGWRAAFIVLLSMLLSPRIFGDSMNNPKDIPFAASFLLGMYGILLFVQRLPKADTKGMILGTLGIAAAINIRIGGLLLICYMGLYVLSELVLKSSARAQLTQFSMLWRVGKAVFIMALFGYLGGLLFWPYGLEAPFTNPFKALKEFSNLGILIRVLFEGENVWSNQLPWYYTPKWMAITAPLFVLGGLVAWVPVTFLRRRQVPVRLWGYLLFAAVFPLAYYAYKHSVLHDAFRHSLFSYAMFVVLSGIAWSELMHLVSSSAVKKGIWALLAALMMLPFIWMVRNHPNQYVYFNETVGGLKGAYGYYETDYWMNSMKQLSEWFVANNPDMKAGKEVIVATNCIEPVKHHLGKLAPQVKYVYTPFDKFSDKKWDYLFFNSRFLDRQTLLNGGWPYPQVLHEAKADGIPLGSISKRTSMADYEAFEALKNKDIPTATAKFKQALAEQPKNIRIYSGYLNTCMSRTDSTALTDAKAALDEAVKITDADMDIVNYLGQYYVRTNNVAKAVETYERGIQLNTRFFVGYYYLAVIHSQNKQLDKAIQYATKGLDYAGAQAKPMLQLLAQLYQQKGDNGKVQQIQQMMQSMK